MYCRVSSMIRGSSSFSGRLCVATTARGSSDSMVMERGNPLLARLRIRLGKIEMNVVVGGIASDHEPDRRDMEAGRMIRIRMAYLHDDQFMALQVDHVSLELLCDHQLVRNLSREPGLPTRKESFRGGIPAHHLNRVGRCDDTGVWEAFPHVVDVFSRIPVGKLKNGLRGQSSI